ncbi:cytochrome P450 [Roseococcus thiosulfatophilus]|uniref:cytochrome P450 n=1 Tax=Roseococcus thiosulfatophilus TaxID=35813 RepID=UPI0030F3E669
MTPHHKSPWGAILLDIAPGGGLPPGFLPLVRGRRLSISLPPAEPYLPPRPSRHRGRLPIWRLFLIARRNLLGVWSEQFFDQSHIRMKVLSRNIFVFNMPPAIQSVMIGQPEVFERKSPQMRHALEPLLGDGLLISDGLVWKERRRVVQSVTHPSRMASLTPVMTAVAVETRDAWAALPAGAELDMLEEMGRFTAEVIGRTIFGTAVGRRATATVVEAFARYQARISNTDLTSVIGLPDWTPRLNGLLRRGEVRRIHRVVDGLIEEVLNAAGGELSLVAGMASHPGMTREAFRNEAITIFMAGHETTANLMAWVWFLLSQAPWAEAALHEELDRVLGGRAPGFEDLPNLPYTRAVVEETLRLYPPIPLLAREANADTEVTGVPVPKGSIVIVAPWVVHRHRAYWSEPDAFRPERFLPGAPPPARFTYLPLALGPRICTGQHFGLYEAMIAVATLAQHFRPRLRPGHVAEAVSRLSLRPGETLPMRLERR